MRRRLIEATGKARRLRVLLESASVIEIEGGVMVGFHARDYALAAAQHGALNELVREIVGPGARVEIVSQGPDDGAPRTEVAPVSHEDHPLIALAVELFSGERGTGDADG